MHPYRINAGPTEVVVLNKSVWSGSIMSDKNIGIVLTTSPSSIQISNTNTSSTIEMTKSGCSDLDDPTRVLTSEMPDGILGSSAMEDSWSFPYSWAEISWGIILLFGIFIVNIWILSVVGRSRELWKPRHLWMACLCVTDLFVGAHKLLDLLLLIPPWPMHGLCVLQKTTLGIPYVVNMLLLTLLSLDRFIAVRHPFFYSSSVSNRHVAIGFFLVILTGLSLAGVSVFLGIRDPICRAQNLQLIYLTVVLTICSTLTLLFNSAVLRIAKRQLNAIYAQEPALGGRRVSVVCGKCGFKNETFVNTLIPMSMNMNITTNPMDSGLPSGNTLLPLTDAVVIGALDMDLKQTHSPITPDPKVNLNLDLESPEIHHDLDSCLIDDTMTPLVRTLSLPTIPDSLSVPVSLVVQPDPSLPPSVIIGNVQTELDLKMTSMSQLDTIPNSQATAHATLPRSRSLVSCRTHKIMQPTLPRLQLFRNLHFARAHMFHMRRLFPSIRFARTVLLIMIPMWVFILPIVTIIPLHRSCEDAGKNNNSEFNCNIVETLWRYLLVHMRSVLPLQAILDTLIYAFGSKEFRQAVKKLMYKRKGQRK